MKKFYKTLIIFFQSGLIFCLIFSSGCEKRSCEAEYNDKNYDEAISCYNELLLNRLSEHRKFLVYKRLFMSYFLLENWQDYAAKINILLNKEKDNKITYPLLKIYATHLFEKNRFADAYSQYQFIISRYSRILTPEDLCLFQYRMALSLYNLSRYDKAKIEAEKLCEVCEIVNFNADAKMLIADMLILSKQYKEALYRLQEFIFTFPNNQRTTEAKYKIGECFENLNQELEAISQYNKILPEFSDKDKLLKKIFNLKNRYLK